MQQSPNECAPASVSMRLMKSCFVSSIGFDFDSGIFVRFCAPSGNEVARFYNCCRANHKSFG